MKWWEATSGAFKVISSIILTSIFFLTYIFSFGLELGAERAVFRQLIKEVRGLAVQVSQVNHSLQNMVTFSERLDQRLDSHDKRIQRMEDWQDRHS